MAEDHQNLGAGGPLGECFRKLISNSDHHTKRHVRSTFAKFSFYRFYSGDDSHALPVLYTEIILNL